jgi:hypothetical protein
MVLAVTILTAALSTASMAVSGATPSIVGDDYLYPSCGGACRPSVPRPNNPETPHAMLAPAPSTSLRESMNPSSASLAARQLR